MCLAWGWVVLRLDQDDAGRDRTPNPSQVLGVVPPGATAAAPAPDRQEARERAPLAGRWRPLPLYWFAYPCYTERQKHRSPYDHP